MSLLTRRRDFALVWIGGLISLTGDWMLLTALPLYVYQMTGSTLATGAMLAARVVPRLLIGSVAGVFVDRWDRRRTLIVTNLLLALGLLPLLLVQSADLLWLVYVVAFAQAAMGQFVMPALGALLPRLVDEDELVAANALSGLSNNLSRLVGPGMGGLIVGMAGLGPVALIDAATFLVASAMTALTTVDGRPFATDADHSADLDPGQSWLQVWHQWLEGLVVVRQARTLTILFGCSVLANIGEGVMGTLFAPFTLTVLDSGDLGYGWLVAAQAIGGIAGGLILTWRPTLASPGRLLGWGAIGLSLIDLCTFNYSVLMPGLAPGLLFMAIVGIPAAGIQAGLSTLMVTATDDSHRGRVLGAWVALGALAVLIGTVLGGTLGDRVGIVTMLNLQSLGYFVAGVIVLVTLSGRVAAGQEGGQRGDLVRRQGLAVGRHVVPAAQDARRDLVG